MKITAIKCIGQVLAMGLLVASVGSVRAQETEPADGDLSPVAVAQMLMDSEPEDVGAVASKLLADSTAGASGEQGKLDALFRTVSAMAAVLGPDQEDAFRLAVADAILAAADSLAKELNTASGRTGDTAADTLGKIYALVFATIANVLGPEAEWITATMLGLLPETYQMQARQAAEDPNAVLGRLRALEGQHIRDQIYTRVLGVVDDAEGNRFSTATTTTTTTTTTTFRVGATTTTTTTTVPPVIPPTQPSPTPVGLR